MAETSLECSLYYGHGVFGSVEEALPCGFESGLRLDHGTCNLRS